MLIEEERFYEENIIPFDCVSSNSLDFGNLITKDFSPLPIPPKHSPITQELNKEVPLLEENPNLIIEISQNDVNKEINEKQNQLGRKKKILSLNYLETNTKSHTRFRADNLFRKTTAHYFKFIVNFFNIIFEAFEFKQKLIKIDYVYIKKLNKSIFNSCKNTKIIEILENKSISPKYKDNKKENNLNAINTIKNFPIIYKLLSESYINLFKNVYYKSERNINLEKYGLNLNIKLPKNKVQMFSDLIEKYNKQGDHKYAERLNNYVKKIL